MLIFVRHSDDSSKNAHRHDGAITSRGKRRAQKVAKKMVSRYGKPDRIYCSPFQRTRETMENMLIGANLEQRPSIVMDPRLSRYFSSKEKADPSIFTKTEDYGVPIYESWRDFNNRVRNFLKELEDKQLFDEGVVIWVITHALVYKRCAYRYKFKIPENIPFMHKFKVVRKPKVIE